MRNIVHALDIGSQNIKALSAERLPAGRQAGTGEENIRILGAAMVPSEGMRRGIVDRPANLVPKLKEAKRELERSSGIPVKSVYVSFGSQALGFQKSEGRVAISTASGEVTPYDVERVLKQARPPRPALSNREILEEYPLNFKVGAEFSGKNPVGLQGESLEVEILFITALSKSLKELIGTVEEAGLAIEDVIPAPLASGRSLLAPKLSQVGAAALDFGAETLGLSVFEDHAPYSLAVFPIGGAHITNDLALGFQLPLLEAERLKTAASFPEDLEKMRKKFLSIAEARLEDMFELVQNHLKKVGRAGLLPGGVVLGGGGARIPGVAEFAKNFLKLPAEVGKCLEIDPGHKLKDPIWAVAVGTALLALDEEKEVSTPLKKPSVIFQKLSSWMRSLIP